ncbi:MAG: hypothetical protein GXP59_07990 [Deltaproteobacteria bacterium]|nr:hypothetical protein [Deltaproteobacteria bacterium]
MLAESHPYIRRIIRFCLLPYCYFKLVPWHECPHSRLHVAQDLLYIFFKLKYYPGNYGLCHLWEKDRSEWAYYYGASYDPYQRQRLRQFVQRYAYQIVFDDKELCEQFCRGLKVPMPEFYGTVEPGGPYRKQIEVCLEKSADKELFIKPIMGRGGKGIMKAVKGRNTIIVKTAGGDTDIADFVLTEKCVLQEGVSQHRAVSQIAPSSVNTIRIITLLTTGLDVILLGALMRFSKEGSFVDNTSAGGISIGIDCNKGELREVGFDFSGNTYTKHPDTEFIFAGFTIPFWKEVVELAVTIQKSCEFYRLVGVDIAVTPNGPVLIEANANPDIIGIEQVNGPILTDKRVFDEFVKYDLLVNQYQRVLYD